MSRRRRSSRARRRSAAAGRNGRTGPRRSEEPRRERAPVPSRSAGPRARARRGGRSAPGAPRRRPSRARAARRAARRSPRRGRRPRRPASPSPRGGPPRPPRGTPPAPPAPRRRARCSTSSVASATATSSRPGSSSRAENSETRSPFSSSSVRLGALRQQRLDERAHLGLGERADERVDDLAADERVHRGDRLGAEGVGDLRVGVDVDLHELDLAVGLGDDASRGSGQASCRGRTTPPTGRRRPARSWTARSRPRRTWRRSRRSRTDTTGGPRRRVAGALASNAMGEDVTGIDVSERLGMARGQRARGDRAVLLRADRRRPLQPHVPRGRRAGLELGASTPAGAPRAPDGARHGSRAHRDRRGRARRRPGPDRRRPVHRRVGERAALLRHGVRRRA